MDIPTAPSPSAPRTGKVLDAAAIVAALGYFVDIYDLILVAMPIWFANAILFRLRETFGVHLDHLEPE